MIVTQNNTFNEFMLNDILHNTLEGAVKIDRKLLDSDIKTVRTREKKSSGVVKKNINKQMKYLLELRRTATLDEKKLRFNCDQSSISSIPLRNEYYDGYKNIEKSSIADYTVTESKCAYITVDYKSLMNGLALELSYPDFIGSLNEIEDELKDINTMTSYDSSILYDFEWLDDLYFLDAKSGKICDSDYYIESGISRDYFLNRVRIDGTYKNLVKHTNKVLLCILLSSISQECMNNRWKLQLLGVSETGFDFKFKIENKVAYEKFLQFLRGSITARILGRKFCFYPDVTIIERE